MEAPVRPAETLLDAVASGDPRRILVAQRDDLARRIVGCDSDRDAAALHARLADVSARLDALPAGQKGTALDELGARRAAGDGVAPRAMRPGRR